MKKTFSWLLIALLILSLSACWKGSSSLVGYWMSDTGETISFADNETAIISGLTVEYSIFDKNKISFYNQGHALSFKFELDGEELILTDLSTDKTQTYYKDEEKQNEIKQDLNLIATQQTEQIKAEQEKHNQQLAEQQLNEYITALEYDRDLICAQIQDTQTWIDKTNTYIADQESLIQEELDFIAEIEAEIADSNYDSDERISLLQEKQDLSYEKIERYDEQISVYKDQITEYNQQILILQSELDEITEELSKLNAS